MSLTSLEVPVLENTKYYVSIEDSDFAPGIRLNRIFKDLDSDETEKLLEDGYVVENKVLQMGKNEYYLYTSNSISEGKNLIKEEVSFIIEKELERTQRLLEKVKSL